MHSSTMLLQTLYAENGHLDELLRTFQHLSEINRQNGDPKAAVWGSLFAQISKAFIAKRLAMLALRMRCYVASALSLG